MITTSNVDELREVINKFRIVLVAFIDKKSDYYSIAHVLRFFEKIREPSIYSVVFTITDDNKSRVVSELGVKDIPTIRLYINGNIALEQYGVFESYDSNLYALKEGVKSVLRSRGIRFLV